MKMASAASGRLRSSGRFGSHRSAIGRSRPSHLIEEYTDGRATVIERWAVESIPDIGDGSSCAGEQIPVPQ